MGLPLFVLFHFCTVGGEVTQGSAKALRLVRVKHCAPIWESSSKVEHGTENLGTYVRFVGLPPLTR